METSPGHSHAKISEASKRVHPSLCLKLENLGSDWRLTYRDHLRKYRVVLLPDYHRVLEFLRGPVFWNQIDPDSPFLPLRKLTLAQAWRFYLAAKPSLSPRTRHTYHHWLRCFLAVFGKEQPPALRPDRLKIYLDQRAGLLSPWTYRAEVQLLHKFFAWLVTQGEIPSSPVQWLHAPQPCRRCFAPLLYREEFQLLALATPDNLLRLLLALDLGLVASMIFPLEWKHFNLQNRTVSVSYPQSKLHVILPLTSRLFDALLSRLARQQELHPHFAGKKAEQRLFSFRSSSPNSTLCLWRLRKRVPFPLRPHSLRDTFAERLLDASGNQRLVEYCVGSPRWRDQQFNHNVPPSLDELREIFARLEQRREREFEKLCGAPKVSSWENSPALQPL